MKTSTFWGAMVIVMFVAGIIAGLAENRPVTAQQAPYRGYVIEGGCLYITAQGYAVIREWAPYASLNCK